MLKCLILFIVSFSVIASDLKIKDQLEGEIKSTYLKFLEQSLGECSGSNHSCIQEKDDYMIANFRDKEICMPYTVCGFYHCMENKYQCNKVGVNYFTELAFPTCTQYVKNISENKFSDVAVEWIYSVMVCLQKGLVEECEVNGNCNKETKKQSCDYITDFTLKFHPVLSKHFS